MFPFLTHKSASIMEVQWRVRVRVRVTREQVSELETCCLPVHVSCSIRALILLPFRPFGK
jgi:hypothetical protein